MQRGVQNGVTAQASTLGASKEPVFIKKVGK